ncbi:MAG TPA: cysteine rich repeat-containing protein, partial [Xanthomonadales bacterium]|nr:cysteine rich repeat-containing protein [Xanthomonadales bacterium]
MNKEKYGKFSRRLRRASFTCLVAILASPAVAQQPNQVQANAIKQACRADFQKNCAGVPAGGSAALVCLQTHAANLSSNCQNALLSANGQSEPENQQAITMLSAETWPQNVTGEGGSAVVYQPQVISWPDRLKLITRIALSLNPKDAEQPVLGTIEVSFATSTDLTTRWVTLSSASLIKSNFPAADTEQAGRFENSIRAGLAALDLKRIPLDTLLLSLRDNSETPASVALRNEPPQIFYSQSPASLLVFDGEPVMAPVAKSGLKIAVNTNWNVFFESGSKTWFWLNNDFW